MSDADGGGDDGLEMTTVTLKIPQSFLDDLDATWRAEDFPSRSEFIRWALRDAVKHPSFTRKAWKDIATSERQRRTGEGATYGSDEIRSGGSDGTDDDE